jgi:GTP-binding protein
MQCNIAVFTKQKTVTKFHYEKAKFLLSVADLKQLPKDEGFEVAMVGRSNAGKSSVLNQLTQNKGLARVSKTPGRTQLINLFGIDEERRLADLPGYGFAKVPMAVKKQWQALLESYLHTRQCLKGLILVMDIRHPLKDFDKNMLQWCVESNLPVHILLNKSDKLSQSAIHKTKKEVAEYLKNISGEVTLQTFSATKGTGIKELRDCIDSWLS